MISIAPSMAEGNLPTVFSLAPKEYCVIRFFTHTLDSSGHIQVKEAVRGWKAEFEITTEGGATETRRRREYSDHQQRLSRTTAWVGKKPGHSKLEPEKDYQSRARGASAALWTIKRGSVLRCKAHLGRMGRLLQNLSRGVYLQDCGMTTPNGEWHRR